MKRFMIVVFLCALLALSGTVFAASDVSESGQDARLQVPVSQDIDKQDKVDDSEQKGSDKNDRGFVSPNGAIWPQGVW